MSKQIEAILKKELAGLEAYSSIDAETKRNKLKEALQFYVLNFVYHHSEYSKWVMYGGSALRIIHGLDRMSVDLDFEVPDKVTKELLEEIKSEIESHFVSTYGVTDNFLVVTTVGHRSLVLKFNLPEELSFGHSSKQVQVKLDLNNFVAPHTVTERRPTTKDQLSFVINTYNMSALMASKLAAIFLREERGVDKEFYDYKGRDIYDLLWYMSKSVTPDLDYLNAKLRERGQAIPHIKALFDKLTTDILNYSKMDELLRADLAHLFENQHQFTNWLDHWRETYRRLLDNYKIHTIAGLDKITIFNDLIGRNYHLNFWYNTAEKTQIRIVPVISDYWVIFRDVSLSIEADPSLDAKIEFGSNDVSSRQNHEGELKKFATLFSRKIRAYLDKTSNIVIGDQVITKVIRMTADNLNT